MKNKLIKPESLVFDIGANVGQSAIKFLQAGAKTVVSVEACWKNYVCIPRRKGIVPVHAAAWHNSGFTEIRYAISQCGLSTTKLEKWSRQYPETEWDDPEIVTAVTLDQLSGYFGLPDVVKVDVEGAELEVLMGMHFRPKILFFEFHWKEGGDAVKCLELLHGLGYEKAHYTRQDVDLDTIPTVKIREFIPRWKNDKPEWGNITVI